MVIEVLCWGINPYVAPPSGLRRPRGGPGGQHANRSATKVTLIFNVALSPSLDEESRDRLLDQLSKRLDKNAILRIKAQDTRSQKQNREIAISRFITLLSEALKEPKERVKTKPSAEAKAKRLDKKKKRGRLKRDRSQNWLE